MQWRNQVCLLTGASGGIGQAIAHELAKRGVKLILNGRNESKLRALCARLPGNHEYYAADISDTAQRNQLMNEINTRNDISMLINNAGVSGFHALENIKTNTLESLLNTNLNSPIQLTLGLLPTLKKRPQAYVINVGSTFGSIGFAGFSAYCASKFGLRGFTESLLRELADTTIRVFYLAPRTTSTAINSDTVNQLNTALGNPVDDPNTVAQALILQLQQNQARQFIGWPEKLFVKINGAFPQWVDNALLKKLPIIKKFTNKNPVEVTP